MSPSLKIILGFLAIIMLGAFMLSLPFSNTNGEWLNPIDALFTSTSAVCVTGLQTVNIATVFTLFGKIVLLFLIQIGGLGIVAITSLIFLVLGKKINLSNRLTIQESLNKDTMQGVVKFVKKVIILTFAIEGIGALCMLYSTTTYFSNFGLGLFHAIFLSVSAFCNAGIDVIGAPDSFSLSPFASDIMILLPIMFLIILGGIGFVVLIDGFKNIKTKQHTKVVLIATGVLLLLGFVVFLLCEWNNPATLGNMSIWDKILNAMFQSVTTRTAGFTTIDQSALTNGGTIMTIILMFIGASPNSTACGIKTTTLFVILLFIFKKQKPNGDITFAGRNISNKVISKALKILLFSLVSLLISVCVMRVIEPDAISTEAIIFECVSALSTTGLSMGITTSLTTLSRILVGLMMFLGRIGLTTLALVISTRVDDSKIDYASTDIIIG